MVVDLEGYFDGQKYVCPAKDGGLKINDVITSADGYSVTCNEDLQKILTECNGNTIEMKIVRNKNEITKTIKPVKNMVGMYLIGAWIRDSCAGIGTVTYYDSDKNYFAALGHGICDTDTSQLMPLRNGEVVSASISGITKSTSGKAGSLSGYFTDTKIGTLTQNTPIGIYGTADENYSFETTKIQLADKSEIRTGKAEIYTTISGENIDSYSIEITRICTRNENSNESFIIKITDERLLDNCGGIVQGMSGSPIVQNGKIVGAVTHVFVNDPTKGFGIFVQNMADNYEN
jgi:stage IV sporulation protein B